MNPEALAHALAVGLAALINATVIEHPRAWLAFLVGVVVAAFGGKALADHRGWLSSLFFLGALGLWAFAAAVAPVETWERAQAIRSDQVHNGGGVIRRE